MTSPAPPSDSEDENTPSTVLQKQIIHNLRWNPCPNGTEYAVTRRSLERDRYLSDFGSHRRPIPQARVGLVGRFSTLDFQLVSDADWDVVLHDGRTRIGNGHALLIDCEPLDDRSSFKSVWRDLSVFCQSVLPGSKDISEAAGMLEVVQGEPAICVRHNFFKVSMITFGNGRRSKSLSPASLWPVRIPSGHRTRT